MLLSLLYIYYHDCTIQVRQLDPTWKDAIVWISAHNMIILLTIHGVRCIARFVLYPYIVIVYTRDK